VEKTSVDLVAGAATKTWHEHVPKAHFENLLGRRKLQKFFDLGISNNLADLTGKVTHALGTGVEKTSVDLVAGAATKTWHEHVPKAHFENLLGRKLLDGPQ